MSSDPGGSTSEADLEQIEEDIRLCQQFLSSNKGPVHDADRGSGSVPRYGGGSGRGSAATKEERRKDILDRILAERGSTQSASAAGSINQSRTASASGQSNETREQMIERLVQEKRERDASKQEAQAAARKSRADSSANARRGGGSPDSLDQGSSLRSFSPSGAAPAPGTSPNKRPASAPRQVLASSTAPRAERSAPAPAPASAGQALATAREAYNRRSGSAPLRERPRSASTAVGPPNLSRGVNSRTREALAREREEELRRAHTFRPKLTPYTRGNGQRQTAEERMAVLARSRKEAWEERERARLEREEAQQREHCTFRPKIRARPTSAPPVARVPVEERLLNEAANKMALRQRAKRHVEELELRKECTFAPQINEASRQLRKDARPLHQRVGSLQKERRQRLQEAKEREENANPDLTFRPTINERSVRLAERRGGDVRSRMEEQQEMSLAKRLGIAAEVDAERAAHERFQPAINANSDRILEQSDKFAGKDFFERQMEALEKKQQKLAESALPPEFSFTPEVAGPWAEKVAQERAGETYLERIERLAYRDRDQKEHSRECLQDHYYSQFTFRPTINKISQQLGEKRSVDEISRDTRRKEKVEALRKMVDEQHAAECTFRPAVNPGRKKPGAAGTAGSGSASARASRDGPLLRASADESRHRRASAGGTGTASSAGAGASRYSLDVADTETLLERIHLREQQKEAQAQQLRRRRELKELQECTFTPQILRRAPKAAAGPIVVRGLGRHLELKELARRKADDQAKREKKAFLNDPSALAHPPAGPYTVPEPFALSGYDEERKARKEATRRQAADGAMAECTFRPQTNEGRVRDMLDKILAEEGGR